MRAKLDMSTVVLPEIQQALQAIFRCADEQLPLNVTTLQQLLDEKAFQQIMLAQAQNHDHRLNRQDIDMYLERLQTVKPLSGQVAGTADDRFLQMFADLKKAKGVPETPESEP